MLVNSDCTLYHKSFDDVNKLEVWNKYYFPEVWWYGGKGAGINKGYTDANDLDVRIWCSKNPSLDIHNIKIGDILVQGEQDDITTQQDLSNLDVYNITSINNNNFGSSPHIHLGGK